MVKNKILELIEEGLLDYYVSLNYSKESEFAVAEGEALYDLEDPKYLKLAKRILFKAKLESRKTIQAKIISISEASDRLELLNKEMEGKVFPIFKRHVKEYGLAANYRNFESMTENEMKEILKHLNYTALLDEILSELEDE